MAHVLTIKIPCTNREDADFLCNVLVDVVKENVQEQMSDAAVEEDAVDLTDVIGKIEEVPDSVDDD